MTTLLTADIKDITASYDRGYDSGNYDAAYRSEDLDTARARLAAWDICCTAFKAGYVIGFFSTYERHEVPETYLPELDRAMDWWAWATDKGMELAR